MVSDAVVFLPIVPGRPGAAYFRVANKSAAATALVGVHIEGAEQAEMHETMPGGMAAMGKIDLPPGATAAFERGGRHVMVFGVADTLRPGSSSEMTLVFDGGDKVSAPIKVESMAGGAAH